MNPRERYLSFMESGELDEDSRAELTAIENDEKEITERFYAPLQFGTAGLRGVMSAGLARMNVYTVGQATQGIASYILRVCPEKTDNGVAICYDSRINSASFARLAASIFYANGIKAYIFDSLRPTPELSFAILNLGCVSGVNITASHNPKEYNGYKVYWEDGIQISSEIAEGIQNSILETDIFKGVKVADYDTGIAEGRILILGEETDRKFLDAVLRQAIDREAIVHGGGLNLVYTPFHGAGYKLVPQALFELGFKNIHCVEAQMVTDGNFPTVDSPNPENAESFKLAIELAEKVGADAVIGTDPDSDRLGLCIRDNDGSFKAITGNQTASLLLDYIINARIRTNKMPSMPCMVKSIVSTDMVDVIAKQNGVTPFASFTGFKFIADLINNKQRSEGYNSIFAFEESYGYLIGPHCGDKDAVTAAVLVAEMCAYYQTQGLTLTARLQQLYRKYGYFGEKTINLVMRGVDGLEKMKAVMADLRANPPAEIASEKVAFFADYIPGEKTDLLSGEKQDVGMSGSDVLEFVLSGGARVLVRPSGTEPKMKVYVIVPASSPEERDVKVEAISKDICKIIEG